MTLTAALDLGTTTIRVGLFDESGARVAMARDRLAMSVPFAGAAEQDPDDFVTVFTRLWQELSKRESQPSQENQPNQGRQPSRLGITNQRSTIVAWDSRTGRPLRPAVGWQDTRTAAQVREFVAQGIPVNTSASCTKLQWLLENDAAVGAAARAGTLRFGTVDSWMTWALSGGTVHVTDPTNAAATGLYDARVGDWSDLALGLFGVDRATLPEIVASDAEVGEWVVDGSSVVLAARIGDQMASCVTHDLQPGQAKLSLGTSAMLDVAVASPGVPAPAGCYLLPMWRRSGPEGAQDGAPDDAFDDAYMVEGSINTAGSAVEWLVRIGLLDRVEDLDAVAAEARPQGEVDFLPALAGLGSPHQDPDARARWSGIGLDTTRADLVGAVVDGIAARVAELAGHMEELLDREAPLLVDGGLCASRRLRDAIAAGTGRPVVAADDPETALAGAALLARGGDRRG